MFTTLRRATLEDLADLVSLLDAYRVFYNQSSDREGANEFLRARLREMDSVIFLARIKGVAAGFVQLYPSFSTVSLRSIYILNDLFVIPSYRKQGIGAALLKRSQEFCAEYGYKGLALETAMDNPAQALYERMGWKKDVHCFHYFWTVP
jgi:GNAT superfamily N-acetyltransferase